MKLTDRNIIIVSNEPWGDIWFSKHHYANELSKNNRVLFIDPPARWNILSSVTRGLSEERVNPQLSILRYRNPLPLNAWGTFFQRQNNRAVCKLLNQYIKKQQLSDIVFLSFDPYRLLNPKQLNEISFSIYYRADYYTNSGEQELCQNVDLLLVIAQEMIPNYEHFGKPIYFIPHGVPDETATLSVPVEESNEILMMGTLGPRIDFELLDKVASSHPELTLNLLGPLKGLDILAPADKKHLKQLERRANVIFAGPKTYPEVCKDILRAKVCLVMYKQTHGYNTQNSLKILQYLSFGKPVVSGQFAEFKEPGKEGLLHMAATHDEYLDKLKRALSENGETKLRNRRIDYARNFRYSNLIRDIERIATVVTEKS